MKFLVIEIQIYDNGSAGNNVWAYDTINEAESKYHAVLASAAVSDVPVHSAAILNETGYEIRVQSYNHKQPEPPVPETEE